MESYRSTHVLAAIRTGNSWPVIADTPAGKFLVKLRGAAHGTSALVAEIVAAELAERIGLSVPARALIEFDDDLVSDDRNDELAQLLTFSRGLNLGFQWLEGARDLHPEDIAAVDSDTASRIAWLDWLVMNPDRTDDNPNLLVSHGAVWLIDHGSALGFHHAWERVTEGSPSRPGPTAGHVLRARTARLGALDAELTRLLPRESIRAAVAEVPDDFLVTMRPQDAGAAALRRRREAYVAFLWKRLKSPRPWMSP